MRVTWLTDVHLNFLDERRLDEFLETVAHEHPDLLLVTGDTAESADLIDAIDRLTAIAPVYFVLGNHDFYRSSIVEVRDRARATHRWLPSVGPVRLTDATALVGVDGWGDARCGDLDSQVMLADWRFIRELTGLSASARIDALQALGTQEAGALRNQLARLAPARELIVLTHVPPFAEACWYNGKRSSPEWLPWFSCIAVGEVLLEHARRCPDSHITVLCGHTHGRGEYRAADNLLVRTGGWAPGKTEYGNPIIQASWAVA
ncbi:MAG TPA: metallophosphoesterase [Kofleriaceae bacterium]|nr:metallophosphoesterase [Kofleriaceae bacterium]